MDMPEPKDDTPFFILIENECRFRGYNKALQIRCWKKAWIDKCTSTLTLTEQHIKNAYITSSFCYSFF